MGIFIRWLILTAAIMAASYLIDGIRVSGFFSAFCAAAVLGILNALFRPILFILTLPINIMTLGLFTFIINALLLKMASGVIPGFDVHGFWSAVFAALIISGVNWILSSFINEHGRIERVEKGEMEEEDYIDLEKHDDDTWE
ncbi:MAG: phage holin family protein [Desulfobacteraceae bacterium]|nr:MAG: phage holin family protein [Desulfobacteraceae bacterium]